MITSLFDILAISGALLSTYIGDQEPWKTMEANSEQRQPVYIGASPREMAIYGRKAKELSLSTELRGLGEKQALAIAKALRAHDVLHDALYFEVWPVQNDDGQRTWAFARWRDGGDKAWKWIDEKGLKRAVKVTDQSPTLPLTLRAWNDNERTQIFEDFMTLESLYAKPEFGNCVWTKEINGEIVGAWFDLNRLNASRDVFSKEASPGYVCHSIPQLSRWNSKPVSFVIEVKGETVRWPSEIKWEKTKVLELGSLSAKEKAPLIKRWPGTFADDYRKDIEFLAGATFTKKNSAQPDNQLEQLVDYLEGRYSDLGIRTYRQRFVWRGITQSNLIAVIPGSLPKAKNHPVLMADHIDTAFCEDEFERSRQRMSAPGADDNVTAVAALLRAAEVLRASHPLHDIWLTHITGEEFPADDLGARKIVRELLSDDNSTDGLFSAQQDISGLVLLDMVGYAKKGDKLFQINPGDSLESLKIAQLAGAAAKVHAPELKATVRTRFDKRSYLYNTDGVIFSDSGFPVILFNEHINAIENLSRRHYHETTDDVAHLDFDYATAITKIAIETVARLSQKMPR